VPTPPWFESDVLEAAPKLLGWRLASEIRNERVVVELTEVEAYAGEQDPASHAYRGETARNRVMFGGPGHLYVYLSYGIHWCMNVVIGERGVARAVLLRGGHILEGERVARRRRGRGDHLTDGPGKLSQALGVGGELDGHDVTQRPLRLLPPLGSPPQFATTRRIGISKAVELPWRFVVR